MKVSKEFIWFLILLIGIMLGISIPIKWNGEMAEIALFPFDEHKWEHVFDVINSILLLVTLLTAIFKEQIIDSIYFPKFQICKDDDFCEIIESTETISRATSYEKIIMVQNVGNKSAVNCRLIIDRVSIKSDCDYHATDINYKETVVLPQLADPLKHQFKPQETISFPIFRILPNVSSQDTIPERPMLFQVGDNEIDIMQGKTDYTIVFHIEAENAQSSSHIIIIQWNGKWQSRKTEMKKHLSVSYK